MGKTRNQESAPYFSIIMTSYNYGKYIANAIESVLSQKFQDWELIVVDDFSLDNSWEVISKYTDQRIRAHKLDRNRGGSYAHNYGLELCRGKYIACLDSDDIYHEDKLYEQKNIFEANPEVKICGTWVSGFLDNGDTCFSIEEWFNKPLNLNEAESWIWQNRLCHSSVVFCSSLSNEIGFANNDLKYTPDWEMWIRALVLKVKFFVVEKKLTYSRQHSKNITHSDDLELRREWAKISADYFHPFLWSENRLDLILLNLREFYKDPSLCREARVDQDAFIQALGFNLLDCDLRGSNIATVCAIQSALIEKGIEFDSISTNLANEKFERNMAIAERDMAMAERDKAMAERDMAMAERNMVPYAIRSLFALFNRILKV